MSSARGIWRINELLSVLVCQGYLVLYIAAVHEDDIILSRRQASCGLFAEGGGATRVRAADFDSSRFEHGDPLGSIALHAGSRPFERPLSDQDVDWSDIQGLREGWLRRGGRSASTGERTLQKR